MRRNILNLLQEKKKEQKTRLLCLQIEKQLPTDDIPPPVYYDNPPDDPKTIHVSPDISRENTNADWDDRRPSSRLPPIISRPIAPTVTPSGVNGIDF